MPPHGAACVPAGSHCSTQPEAGQATLESEGLDPLPSRRASTGRAQRRRSSTAAPRLSAAERLREHQRRAVQVSMPQGLQTSYLIAFWLWLHSRCINLSPFVLERVIRQLCTRCCLEHCPERDPGLATSYKQSCAALHMALSCLQGVSKRAAVLHDSDSGSDGAAAGCTAAGLHVLCDESSGSEDGSEREAAPRMQTFSTLKVVSLLCLSWRPC